MAKTAAQKPKNQINRNGGGTGTAAHSSIAATCKIKNGKRLKISKIQKHEKTLHQNGNGSPPHHQRETQKQKSKSLKIN